VPIYDTKNHFGKLLSRQTARAGHNIRVSKVTHSLGEGWTTKVNGEKVILQFNGNTNIITSGVIKGKVIIYLQVNGSDSNQEFQIPVIARKSCIDLPNLVCE